MHTTTGVNRASNLRLAIEVWPICAVVAFLAFTLPLIALVGEARPYHYNFGVPLWRPSVLGAQPIPFDPAAIYLMLDPDSRTFVSTQRDATYWVPFHMLAQELRDKLANAPHTRIVLSGDRRLSFAAVARVLRVLMQLHPGRVYLAFDGGASFLDAERARSRRLRAAP